MLFVLHLSVSLGLLLGLVLSLLVASVTRQGGTAPRSWGLAGIFGVLMWSAALSAVAATAGRWCMGGVRDVAVWVRPRTATPEELEQQLAQNPRLGQVRTTAGGGTSGGGGVAGGGNGGGTSGGGGGVHPGAADAMRARHDSLARGTLFAFLVLTFARLGSNVQIAPWGAEFRGTVADVFAPGFPLGGSSTLSGCVGEGR
jgi:hypothetical protein